MLRDHEFSLRGQTVHEHQGVRACTRSNQIDCRTSGHGICGLGRLSPRSFVAVCTFVFSASVSSTATIARYESRCEEDTPSSRAGLMPVSSSPGTEDPVPFPPRRPGPPLLLPEGEGLLPLQPLCCPDLTCLFLLQFPMSAKKMAVLVIC